MGKVLPFVRPPSRVPQPMDFFVNTILFQFRCAAFATVVTYQILDRVSQSLSNFRAPQP